MAARFDGDAGAEGPKDHKHPSHTHKKGLRGAAINSSTSGKAGLSEELRQARLPVPQPSLHSLIHTPVAVLEVRVPSVAGYHMVFALGQR